MRNQMLLQVEDFHLFSRKDRDARCGASVSEFNKLLRSHVALVSPSLVVLCFSASNMKL